MFIKFLKKFFSKPIPPPKFTTGQLVTIIPSSKSTSYQLGAISYEHAPWDLITVYAELDIFSYRAEWTEEIATAMILDSEPKFIEDLIKVYLLTYTLKDGTMALGYIQDTYLL